ncbi:MAG: type II secretion system F family protein [Burkholderiaceae bacterium]|nr:type II secretion system F family protein [Burkholderiaceae bacterium]
MPVFAYAARDAGGRKISGELDSADLGTLADTLATQGLLLVRAEPRAVLGTDAFAALRGRVLGGLFAQRVPIDDLVMFCRQMATLLRAGVPLLRALKALQESATVRRFADLLGDLQQQLEAGHELSAALRSHPAVFTPYMVNMVRVGELTGRLSDVFNGLYAQLSFARDSRNQIKTALRYPMFVIATALMAIVAVNLFVIPSFAKVYKGLKADLPVVTQLLIGVSNFMLAWWPLLLALALGGLIGARMALRQAWGRRLWDTLLLKTPIIGPLVHKAALARFTRSFGLALDAGVPVVDALQVASETTDNVLLAERIASMRIAAERGESLARAARSAGVFTPTILQMIAVGEETGALGEMMNEVAGHYQREVDYAVKSIGAQIEPILIVFLGGFVLVFALGVFLPLWDLSKVAIR